MSSEALMAWPDRKNYESLRDPGPHDAEHCRCTFCGSYYKVRAEAALARLRAAVRALKAIESGDAEYYEQVTACEALTSIGELP